MARRTQWDEAHAGRLAWVLLSAGLALSPNAWGNGRYPAAGQIAVDAGDPAHLIARTTYGLLQSGDAGASWQWICETAVGYEDATDPFVAIPASGRMVVATTHGLAVSPDRGCVWSKLPGTLGQWPAIDLVLDRHNPARVLALLQHGDGGVAGLAVSEDGGAQWTDLGTPLPAGFIALTVEVAPSDPKRIYVSGKDGENAAQSVLQVSKDGGQSWLRLPLAASDFTGDFIGAVDPVDPDRLYVRRRQDTGDALLASSDGGETWTQIASAPKSLLGFALSPDGSQVAVGAYGAKPGIFLAQAKDLQFSQRSKIGARCLTWTAEGLYVCADEAFDHFTVGVSKDAGLSVQPLHHRNGLTPLQCAKGTRTGNECPKAWSLVAPQLGIALPATGGDTVTPRPASGSCQAAPSGGGWPWWVAVLLRFKRRRA